MKHTIKTIISLLLAVTLIFGMTSCGGKNTEGAADRQDTLSFTLGPQPWAPGLISALKQKFPDIRFDVEYYYGCNTSEYIKTQLANDDFGDLYFGTTCLSDEIYTDRLLNLSGYDFTGNYEDALLNQYDINGAIYQLPCTVSIRSMAYNKTMFREHGWKVPKNHRQLVRLCRKIRRESDATPIAFAAGSGLGFYFTTLTTLAQTDFLSTQAGKTWEQKYFDGKASFGTAFDPACAMLQELIDAKAYDIRIDEKITTSDDLLQRLTGRTAAMTALWSNHTEFAEMAENSRDEFGLFPFYSEDGQALLGVTSTNNIGIARRLETPGNEKKLKNALRVLGWLSTEEGMKHLENGGGAELLTLKNTNNSGTSEIYRNLWNDNMSSIKAPMLYSGYEDIMNDVGRKIKDAMAHETDLDELTEMADTIHRKALSGSGEASPGSVAEDLTHPETVQLVADALQSSGLADITLLSDGGIRNGVFNPSGCYGRLYRGEISALNCNVPLPIGFNVPTVVRSLTGDEIAELLETGLVPETDGRGESPAGSTAFDYYWSGMDAVMENDTVKSMRLANGEKIRGKKTYNVLFCANDYAGAGSSAGRAVPQEKTPEQLYRAYLAKNSPLSAPKVLRN